MYLYGDSSSSPLRSNFLEFLRDAMDFGAFVLLADGQIREGKREILKLERAANQEIARLESLGELAVNAITQAPCGAGDSATSRCAQQLRALTEDAVRNAIAGVRGQLSRQVDDVDAREAAEREGCRKALERLLLPHDPWDATSEKQVVLRGDLPTAMSYVGRATAASGAGWAWTMELAVPNGHPFTEPMRLDRLMPHIEISVPDVSGWLKKEVRVKPQRIERMVVTELFVDDNVVRAKLRMEPMSDAGFDLEVPVTGQVQMSRTGVKDAALSGPLELRTEEIPTLVELSKHLRECMNGLARRRLVEATYEDEAFERHGDLREIVERLVLEMTPIVREISDHSLTPTELVIKRLLGDDRREEIFVSKASLREKIAGLPDEMKRAFDPLGLTPQLPQYSVVSQPVQPMIPVQPQKAVAPPLPAGAPPGPRIDPRVEPTSTPNLGIAKSPPPPTSSQVLIRTESGAPASTANPDLVASIKKIVQLAKRGNAEEAYQAYAELFGSDAFATYLPEHQRQTLKLLVLAKPPSAVTEPVRKAHGAAANRLRGLIASHKHAADYEMLGVCQLILEDSSAASATFSAGLEIERNRDPGSELCGSLMRRVAAL